ncbi:MAG: hypothetical protein ABEJ05_09900 [Haloglomus sp.]
MWGQLDHVDHGDLVASIPLVSLPGLVVWWVFDLQMHLALDGSSLLAVGALAEVLFLNPPTPCPPAPGLPGRAVRAAEHLRASG